MTPIYRHRTIISGLGGMPGVSTMYFFDVNTAVASVRTFWDALKVYLPSGVVYTPETFGDILDDVSGTITDSWTTGAVTAVTGTGGGVYAAPAGAQVRWNTSVIRDGRRLRGRTFIVPVVSGAYESNGTLIETFRTAAKNAADAFIAAQNASFCIWHRPVIGRAAVPGHAEIPHRDGDSALVSTAAIPDKVAVLRSRRD